MSTALSSESNMSERHDSTNRTGISSSSITRLPGKGSKSIIPRSLTPAPNSGFHNIITADAGRQSGDEMNKESEVIILKTEKQIIQNELNPNPGDRETPRNRMSGLPTSRRQGSKNSLNQNNSLTIKSKSKSVLNSNSQKRQLENQFSLKKQKYLTLKKELTEKQKQAFDLYDDVSDLREKLIAAGIKDPGKIEKLINQGKIETRESKTILDSLNCDELPRFEIKDSVLTIDFVDELESKLNEIPNVYLKMCQEALGKRSEIITWICDFLNKENPGILNPETVVKELEIYKNEDEGLKLRVDNIVDKNKTLINEILIKFRAIYDENESYKIYIKELEKSGEILVNDLKEKLKQTFDDIEIEKDKVTQLKERKNVNEIQLQKAKTRIRELENIGSSNETKIQQLQASLKNFETQIKQKEAAIDSRTKDMQKSIKNSEIILSKTEKQRDSLETRVNELKKKIDANEEEFNERIKNVTKQFENTKKQFEQEKELKIQAENKVKELNERCLKLEEKSKQLCDLAENKTKDLSVKPVDEKYTENEIQLWNDLQKTRNDLKAKEEKLLQIKQEKEKIISDLHEAADRKNPGSIKELAADLVTKTEELRASNAEREELKNNLKTAIEKSENFERQLSELQSKLHAQTKEGGKTGWGAHTIEVEQQLCDVKSTLRDLINHNEELEISLTQKQLELEQRDRIMREQSKVLKVRDELIGLLGGGQSQTASLNLNEEFNGLQNSNLDDPRMQLDSDTISRLVNKQIESKAEDLQSLYSNLENKQMQLMRLEKVVRQMEDDNDRSQVTRTKLEREVAKLRLQLHEKNRSDNRYVAGTKPTTNNHNNNNNNNNNSLKKLNSNNYSFPTNSRSLIGITNKNFPKLSTTRHNSDNLNDVFVKNNKEGMKIIDKTAAGSGKKLRDVIRAVEIERARGSVRASRSLQRGDNYRCNLKTSKEIKEDLYNWLVQDDFNDYNNNYNNNNNNDNNDENNDNQMKKEFVKHSRAIFNFRNISRNREKEFVDEQRATIFCKSRLNRGGSREFGNRDDCSCFLTKSSDPSLLKKSGKLKRS